MKTFINLIPIQYRRRNLVRRRLRQWSLVWVLCLIVVVAIGYRKVNRYRLDRQTAQLAAERHRPLDELIHETRTMRSTLGDLKAKGTLVAQLQDERPVIALLGLASRSAARSAGHLHLTKLEYDHERQLTVATGGPPRNPKASRNHKRPEKDDTPQVTPATVHFAGEALDNLTIAGFAAALRDSRMFRHVELKSSVEGASGTTSARSFNLTGEI